MVTINAVILLIMTIVSLMKCAERNDDKKSWIEKKAGKKPEPPDCSGVDVNFKWTKHFSLCVWKTLVDEKECAARIFCSKYLYIISFVETVPLLKFFSAFLLLKCDFVIHFFPLVVVVVAFAFFYHSLPTVHWTHVVSVVSLQLFCFEIFLSSLFILQMFCIFCSPFSRFFFFALSKSQYFPLFLSNHEKKK